MLFPLASLLSPAIMPGKAVDGDPGLWVPATYMGDLDGIPGFWLQLNSTMAATAI